jgi:hypothetical protein
VAASPAARTPDRTGAHRNEPTTKSQTSPAALVIYSLSCLSPARISYSRPTRRLIASLSLRRLPTRLRSQTDARSTLGEEGSTLRLTTTERRLKLHTPPESQSRIGITAHLLSPPSGRIRVLSLAVSYVSLSLLLSHTRIYIYIYLGSYSDGRIQSGAPSHTRVRADDEPDTRPTIGEEGSALWLTTTKRRTSRTLLPKASRASASPATPISKHVFFSHRVGHEALMGEPVGSHRAFGKGVQRAIVQ